ncbi:MAG: SDR family NAD(P)-dependent oxidoreductase [Ignavibacteriales bacterium]|nr:SDR family NAD(P)-dependent oxidoreductase [Ignavibacteriales bacterium]
MKKLENKNVFITGASAGIGKACAYAFANEGSNIIMCARRKEKLEKIADNIKNDFNVDVDYYILDVTDQKAVEEKVYELSKKYSNIDFLINNAGLAKGLNKFPDDKIDDWEDMIDTNIKGLLYVTKAVLPIMIKNNAGHIINLGSIAGHEAYPKGAVYCATKFAVDAITKSLRMDILENNIKVTSIDPGMVETEFSEIRFYGDKERAKQVYKGLKPLTAEDIAETIIFCATRPEHVNINELVIMPKSQANAFISYRKND